MKRTEQQNYEKKPMHSVTGSLNKNWISKKGKIEEKISNFHGEESNCCRVDELAAVCSMSYKHNICLKNGCMFSYSTTGSAI